MPTYPIYQVGSFVLDETNGVYLHDGDDVSSTPLNLDVQEVARRSGGKVVSATLGTRKIPLKGRIVGTSWADLNTKLDSFKAACIGTNLSLDVDDGSICKRHIVNTDGQAVLSRTGQIVSADFSITYRAADPPFGQEATRGGSLITTTALNDSNVTLDIYTPNPLTFLGTAPPAAKVTITVTTAGDLTSLEFVDVTNSRTLAITPSSAIATGDVIVIDTSVPSVTLNNQAVAFSGVFPTFQPSANSQIAVYAYTSTGLILDQSQKVGNTQQLLYSTTAVVAQKWTTSSTAGPLSRVQFQASKVGSPTSAITVTIKADNGSGTAPTGAALATATVAASAVNTYIQQVTATISSLPSLSASTLYWMLFTVASGCDLNNYYLIRTYSNTPKGYANGQAYLSSNSGSSYTAIASTDLVFKTYRSVQGAKNDIPDANSTNSYVEGFSTTTKKDGANTTANWLTTGPYLTMNGSSAIDQQQTTATINYAVQLVGSTYTGSEFLAEGQDFIAGASGLLKSVDLNFAITDQGIGGSINGYTYTVQICADAGTSPASPGTVLATYSAATNSLNTQAWRNIAFSSPANVVSGTKYWIKVTTSIGGASNQQAFYWAGNTSSSSYSNGSANGYEYIGFSTYQWGNMVSTWSQNMYDFAFKTNITTYASSEQAQTTELASTVADVLSVSQVTNTILTGGAAYQGSASADNGSNFFNIVRDSNAFDTENVPTTIATQLKMRWTLTGSAGIAAYVTGTALYWRKGISLDATTERGAQAFVALSTGNLARADMYVRKVGSPGDLIFDIYSDSAGSPNSLLGTATITASGITADVWGWAPGNLGSPASLTSGTTYWIVPRASATLSNSNKWLILANNNGYAGASKRSSNSGSSWSSVTSNEKLLFRTYGTTGNNFAYNTRIDYTKAYL